MKTKINLKKGVLLFTVVSMLIGCGITAIPLVVNKDVSLGVINVNGLQNSTSHAEIVNVDFTKLIDDDEFNSIESATLKSMIFTLNADYNNTVTQSENFEGYWAVYLVTEGESFTVNNRFKHTLLSTNLSQTFNKLVPKNMSLINVPELKSLITDKKMKVGLMLWGGSTNNLLPFNDNAFSFGVKAETEVQLAL